MSILLLEAVQEKLHYPVLLKIDTTTDLVVNSETLPNENAFSQAALPAVLTALTHFAMTDEGATAVLANKAEFNWIDSIFEANKTTVIETIADYAGQSTATVTPKLATIAAEAVNIAKEHLPLTADIEAVKLFFNAQKNNHLLYLIPALHIGTSINDNALDDNTNKMEGPMSSLITSIGELFSSPASKDVNTPNH